MVRQPWQIALLTIIILLSTIGAAGVAAGQAASTADEVNSNGWKVTDTETGETFLLSGEPPFDDANLAPSVYHAEHITTEETERFKVPNDDDSVGTSSFHNEYDVETATVNSYDQSIASGEEVTVFVNVKEDNNDYDTENPPAANISVSVLIEKPDGSTTTLSNVTNEYGTAYVTFDTTNEPEGTYDVNEVAVAGDKTENVYSEFRVGSWERFSDEVYGSAQFVDEAYDYAVKASTNGQPDSDIRNTVEIRDESGVLVESETVTTGDSGFGFGTFEPSEAGEYTLKIQGEDRYEADRRINVGSAVAKVYLSGDEYDYDYTTNQNISISGVAVNSSGILDNEELTIEIGNEFTTVADISTSTNSFGVFKSNFTTPSTVQDRFGDRYDITITDSSGAEVVLDGQDTLYVEPPSESTSSLYSENIDVSLQRTDERDYPLDRTAEPGATKEFTVEVTEDGFYDDVGISNKDVSVKVSYDYGITLNETTVQTDSDGEATIDVTVPSSVTPPSDFEIEATAEDSQGNEATGYEYLDIREYVVEENSNYYSDVEPGDTVTASYSVLDVGTGEGVAGKTISMLPTTDRRLASSEIIPAATYGTTGADGTVSLDPTVPDVTAEYIEYDTISPGEYANFDYEYNNVETRISRGIAPPNGYSQGENITFTVQATNETPMGGLIRVEADSYDGTESASKSVVFPATVGEEITLNIPDDYTFSDDIDIESYMLTEDGLVTEQYEYLDLTVENENPSDDSFNEMFEYVDTDMTAGSDDGSGGSDDGSGGSGGSDDGSGGSGGSDDGSGGSDDGSGGSDATTGASVGISNTTVSPSASSESVDITADVPNGINTVNLTVSLDDSSVADIDGVNDEAGFGTGFQEGAGTSTAATNTFRAANLAGTVSAGEDQTLFSVDLTNFAGAGNASDISVTVNSFANGTGGSPSVATSNGKISIQDNPFSEPITGDNPPANPNPSEDNLYQDVNGDGEVDFDDAVAIAFVPANQLTDAQKNAFDFDGDGDIDFDDAVALAFSDAGY